MMRPSGISGILDRFRDMSRRRLIIFSVVGLLVLILLVFVLQGLTGGEPSEVTEDAGEGEAIIAIDFSEFPEEGEGEAVPGSDPGGASLMSVDEQVKATVAAMNPTPTPTLVPTPNIAATVQAGIASRQGSGSFSLAKNPLDAGVMRSPELTSDEKLYFAAMGDDLWVASQVYLRLIEVSSSEYQDWSGAYLKDRLSYIEALLETFSGSRPAPSSSNVGDVVITYVAFIDQGIASVKEAVEELRGAVKVFEESEGEYLDELEASERDLLRQHYLSMNGLLLDFYSAMSSYGCSACGELFRSAFVLE